MPLTLCHIDDIPEGEARGFTFPQANLIGIKKQDKVYLYLNRCPHLKVPLEWHQHQFLDQAKQYIKCSTHGALFQIDTGACIFGPCQGDSLWQIEYQIKQKLILIDEEELPALP